MRAAQLDPGQGRWRAVRRLRRDRPRNRFLRASLALLAALVGYAWVSGDIQVGALLGTQRLDNVARFLKREAVPYPLRDAEFSFAALWDWAQPILSERGLEALVSTFWISILAMVLAGCFGWMVAPLAARTLMAKEPYLDSGAGSRGSRGIGWRFPTALVRGACVLLRALPEYAWAFLLLAILGPTAWPLVLALAVHNAGILGRLSAETLENLDSKAPRALWLLGAGRAQIAWTALRPRALPRLLLFFFYRYETCVREATVLGMLGVASLGYWIHDARVRQRYDEMLLFVALGAMLVLLVELASYVARRAVRKGT